MTEQNLTHWKKNNDSRYISGEDLIAELNGLRKEMIVEIEKFEDTETFDMNKNEKKIATGLWLKEVGGKSLYKPVILNKTNAKFFVKETGSDFIDHWLGIPVVLYAQKDSRHGHVVRFKKHHLPVLQAGSDNFNKCRDAIHKNGYTMDQIRKKYQVSQEVETMLMAKANG